MTVQELDVGGLIVGAVVGWGILFVLICLAVALSRS